MTLVSCRLVITPQARSAPPGRGDLSDARPAHSAGAAAPGGAEATAAEHRPLTTSSQKLSYLFESPCERGRAAACVRPCQFTCRRRCQFTWVPSMRVYISIAVVVEKKSLCFYARTWRSVRALPRSNFGCNPGHVYPAGLDDPLHPFACRASVRTRFASAYLRSCAAQSCSRC